MKLTEDQLILVDENDTEVGVMGKLETHQKGVLHRAFSIIAKNSKNEIMLQKRALTKYHSGGLWTNTCCGHPRVGEDIFVATNRRLGEEMGFGCFLKEVLQFTYKAKLDNELTEHEFLHVFVGEYNQQPVLNPEEASDFKWMSFSDIESDIEKNGDKYTFWFKILVKKIKKQNIF